MKEGVYYLNSNIASCNKELIKYLYLEAEKDMLNIARCCLHKDEMSALMTMIIIVRNRFIYPPHRHSWKDESYTIIDGSCIYKEYSDKGVEITNTKLVSGDTLLNNNKRFHTLFPLTNKFSFVETTMGPFQNQKLEYLNVGK
tara:strand:- start:3788 stop:4213 length:426 start_codon:yes stop_codon:yes gene_type:complete